MRKAYKPFKKILNGEKNKYLSFRIIYEGNKK